MLNCIGLTNFKAFNELPAQQLLPITALCGANSSGKSSILHSLLLLKQTLDSQNHGQPLLLNGAFVHLGRFESITHRQDIKNLVKIEAEFTIKEKGGKYSSNLPISFFLPPSKEKRKNATSPVYSLRTIWSFRSDDTVTANNYIRPIITESFTAELKAGGNQSEFAMTRNGNGTYLIKWSNLHFDRFIVDKKEKKSAGEIDHVAVSFSNLKPDLGFKGGDSSPDNQMNMAIVFFIEALFELLKREMKLLSYVGPLREEPARKYIYEDEVVQIGTKGENAAYIYLTERHTSASHSSYWDEKSDNFVEIKDLTLEEALCAWLKTMGIPSLSPESEGDVIQLRLSPEESKEFRVNIADVGFGISQIFPILLEGLRLPHGGTLMLEQPEIHLHPAMQMRLADFFVSMALSGKQLIVETHSEHIINRLVRRIVEDTGGKLDNLVKVYFVQPKTEDRAIKVEEIRIDPLRGISNWPSGFFDQTSNEMERIIRAGIAKRSVKK